MQQQKNVRIIPLGGCGEIGMNMTLLAVGDRFFFIDGGALFPDSTNIGVDLILPDTRYLDEKGIRPEAWLITHGHEDHIGALPFLFRKYPAPIYGTKFTLELIKAKFTEAGIQNVTYRTWTYFRPTPFRNLSVTPFPVNHSIADAAGFFMETPLGNILHMGDFRIDYNPPEKSTTHENLQRVLQDKEVTLMMSDSTNSFNLGLDGSEGDIGPVLEDAFEACTDAVIVATFASNIWRLQTIFAAAKKTGRKVLLFGRTMLRNVEIGQKLGFLNFNPEILIRPDELRTYGQSRRRQLCILSTGSQGEPFSGLYRLACGSLSEFQVTARDTVLMSSRIIPGNEKAIDEIITQFARIGCQVVTTKENPGIHVSGHGYAADLMTCIKVAKPLAFMPVHGTFRHLKKHRQLAISCGVSPENSFLVENGDVVMALPVPLGVVDKIHSGRDYVCPGGIYSQSSLIYKERVALVRSGVVAVSLHISLKNYQLIAAPQITGKGLVLDQNAISKKAAGLYNKIAPSVLQRRKKGSEKVIEEELRMALRKYLEDTLRIKTTILMLLTFS